MADIFGWMIRAAVSAGPPGGKDTMNSISRFGYSAWPAAAGTTWAANITATTATNTLLRMGTSLSGRGFRGPRDAREQDERVERYQGRGLGVKRPRGPGGGA